MLMDAPSTRITRNMYSLAGRCFSTSSNFVKKDVNSSVLGVLERRNSPLPLPHRTILEPKGQDLDFVNVACSHLIHSDWTKLKTLASGFTPFRIKHILLKIQKDHVLSLEFFDWVELQQPNSHTRETQSIILHILTKAKRFGVAESILRTVIPKTLNSPSELFDSILYSYRLCNSSPCVFDSLFRTYAHMKKFRNATDTFLRMREYGFLPTIESCNAYMSSLLDAHRTDIVLALYREMGRCRISPNIYTVNMVISALCKSRKLERAVELFNGMENMGCRPTVTSFNILISGHCNLGLLSSAMKLKATMKKQGLHPNVITYNTLIHGFCKEGNLHDANKLFNEMKAIDVQPNTVTYNILINGCSQKNNSDLGSQLYEEMVRNGVTVDILTYNALILGLCKEGKTKKASNLVKGLAKEDLVPNASTFSALIAGQCNTQNSEHAFQLFRRMKKHGYHPNANTFTMLTSTFSKNKDFEGAVEVLKEMLERSMTPDAVVLSELFEGLCRYGKANIAIMLCEEIEAKHRLPEGFDKLLVNEVLWSKFLRIQYDLWPCCYKHMGNS